MADITGFHHEKPVQSHIKFQQTSQKYSIPSWTIITQDFIKIHDKQ